MSQFPFTYFQQTVYRQCMENATKAMETMQAALQNGTTTPAPPIVECHKPWSLMSSDVFPNLWRIVYWTSQCLTWLVFNLLVSPQQNILNALADTSQLCHMKHIYAWCLVEPRLHLSL